MNGERIAVEVATVWPEDLDAEEGVVVDWFVRAGKRVEEGETLCSVQVEKVSVDVPSPGAGELVEIVVGEEEAFSRDDTLAWIDPI